MLQLNATLLNSGSLKNNTKKNTCVWNIYETYNTHAFTTAPLPGVSKAMIFQRIFNGPSPRMIAAFKLHVDDMATKTKKHLLYQMQMPSVVSCWKHHQVSGFKVLITYMFISGFGMPFLTIEATPSDYYDFFLGLCMVHFSEAALVFFNHLPKVSTQWMGDQKTDKYMVIYSLQNKLNDCKRLFFSSAFRFISN